MSDRLFPPHLLHARWRTFEAAGYTEPVTGIVYRGEPRPTCGMPLGGLDTGCIDVEPNGMFGYNTIFNHLVEPRALLNLPMLGLACQRRRRRRRRVDIDFGHAGQAGHAAAEPERGDLSADRLRAPV